MPTTKKYCIGTDLLVTYSLYAGTNHRTKEITVTIHRLAWAATQAAVVEAVEDNLTTLPLLRAEMMVRFFAFLFRASINICILAPDYARQKFSNAKSISSDQYFGNDKNDSNNYEKDMRLSRFQGATSISSADYYERDESVTISGMLLLFLTWPFAYIYITDMSASDVARRIAYNAKTDLGQLSSVVVEGGKKVTIFW